MTTYYFQNSSVAYTLASSVATPPSAFTASFSTTGLTAAQLGGNLAHATVSATGAFTETSGGTMSVQFRAIPSGQTPEASTTGSTVTYLGAVSNGTSSVGYVVYQGPDYHGNYTYYFIPTADASSYSSATLTIDTTVGITIQPDSAANPADWSYSCFCAGTHIATPSGAAAVETLQAGNAVRLADGRTARIKWLGRQTVSSRFADPLRAYPIRIKAHALAQGAPARDLLLSPDHAVLVDGLLVQAGALVNGVSIIRETQVPPSFIYYHIELAEHSLILAENTPAETFIDNADRMNFDNWQEHLEAIGDTAITEMAYPRAKAAAA